SFLRVLISLLSFFTTTAHTELYTLSLHDALPIWHELAVLSGPNLAAEVVRGLPTATVIGCRDLKCAANLQDSLGSSRFRIYTSRSEEHTSELQSRENLVCRLLLEKKKNT